MKKTLYFVLLLYLFCKCSNKEAPSAVRSNTDSLGLKSRDAVVNFNDSLISLFPTDTIMGYRFQFVGDFDRDKVADTLIERFVNDSTGLEVAKFYPVSDFMKYQSCQNRRAFLSYCNENTGIILGDLGIAFGEVLPDVNDNGKDEIGYVMYHADMSSVNSYRIVELEDGKWRTIYSFGIRDWELPLLPDYAFGYGYFGVENQFVIESDSLNKVVLRDLEDYVRVAPIKNKTITFEGYLKSDETDHFTYYSSSDTSNALWLETPQNLLQLGEKSRLIYFDLENWNNLDSLEITKNGIDNILESGSFSFQFISEFN
ncbi:MAG: hypothetical protein ACI9N1_002482 [Flavobacteriales bacterium]|jgi:hypothetical protein